MGFWRIYCAWKHMNSKEWRESSNSFISWLQTCSRSPGGPGYTGAAPYPGVPNVPAACAVHRVSHGPGLGWSDAGGTDLHPWVPHTGDSTLSHQHTATSSTKQNQEHGRADRPKQSKASKTGRHNRTRHNETRQDTAAWSSVPGSQSKH